MPEATDSAADEMKNLINHLQGKLEESEKAREHMQKEMMAMKEKMTSFYFFTAMFKRLPESAGGTVPPIDAKDLAVVEPFGEDARKFLTWSAGLRDLLVNRHQGWSHILDTLENLRNTKYSSWEEKWKANLQCTSPNLPHTFAGKPRGMCTSVSSRALQMECLDALSELVCLGKYKNKFKILDWMSAITSPPRANSPQEVQEILMEWKHQTHTVQVHDKDFVVADDLKVTLLHRVMPQALRDAMGAPQEQIRTSGTTTGANKIYMAPRGSAGWTRRQPTLKVFTLSVAVSAMTSHLWLTHWTRMRRCRHTMGHGSQSQG